MNNVNTAQILLLDIGNTRTKWCLIDANAPSFEIPLCKVQGAIPHKQNQIPDLPNSGRAPIAIICACVSSTKNELAWKSACENAWGQTPWHKFESSAQALGIINAYAQGSDLGVDRWAAILGAKELAPLEEVLIVNAGTATTFDHLKSDGQHMGGWIIPGLEMMITSLASGTAGLPRVGTEDLPPPTSSGSFGKSTQDCIQMGCLQTQIGAVVLAAQNNSGISKIILSGGNAALLEQSLHQLQHLPPILHDPHLVLRGLYAWWKKTS